MTLVKLSGKYQIVIPEDVRRELDLKPGLQFQVFAFGAALRIVPARRLSEAFGLVAGGAGAATSTDPRDHEKRP